MKWVVAFILLAIIALTFAQLKEEKSYSNEEVFFHEENVRQIELSNVAIIEEMKEIE